MQAPSALQAWGAMRNTLNRQVANLVVTGLKRIILHDVPYPLVHMCWCTFEAPRLMDHPAKRGDADAPARGCRKREPHETSVLQGALPIIAITLRGEPRPGRPQKRGIKAGRLRT